MSKDITKTAIYVVMVALTGYIAAYYSIPLTAYWFDVTITISGATPVAGMYWYAISSFVVCVIIAFIGFVIAGLINFFSGYKG